MAGEEVHLFAQTVLQRHVLAVRAAQFVNQFQAGARRVDFQRDGVLGIENILMRLVPVVGRNLAVRLQVGLKLRHFLFSLLQFLGAGCPSPG